MAWNELAFKEKLENEHSFPGQYIFKFIVPIDKENEVLAILPDGEISKKTSSNNNYVSITLKALVQGSGDVIRVYKSVTPIPGLIAL